MTSTAKIFHDVIAVNARMDRNRENIEVKTPKTKQVSSNTKDNYCRIFLLFSLTSYNAMTRASGDSRLLFPKSKCMNVRTNKLENSHTR